MRREICAGIKGAKMSTDHFSRVILFYLVLAFFAVPHLIDDFLYEIPAEFGLSVLLSQVLAGVFIVIYLVILISLARRRRGGLYSAISMGGFLALAGILKHVPLILQPGPYWSGWFSELLIFGLIFSGLAVVLSSLFVLRKV
jgi:hypothetical protein